MNHRFKKQGLLAGLLLALLLSNTVYAQVQADENMDQDTAPVDETINGEPEENNVSSEPENENTDAWLEDDEDRATEEQEEPREDAEAYEDLADEEECVGLRPDSEHWVDIAHNYISVQFCEPAVWFDSFFASDRAEEELRAGSRVRWRTDFIQFERGRFERQTDISAKLKLPKASDQLRLTFESEQEEDLKDVLPDNSEETRARVGLLYELFQSPRANFSVRVQLRPKIRLRYRYSWHVTDTFITRFTEDLERTKSVNSASSRVDFEKTLSNDMVFRWSNTFTISEEFDGKEWGVGLILFKQLSPSSAFSYEAGVTGVTEPVARETNYRVGLRYRKNFYRKWLFYELIPEVTWPLDLVTDERDEIAAFIFRLDINFENLR